MICLGPLSSEQIEALACGHRLHATCLERHRSTHRQAFAVGVAFGTSEGSSGARYPLCNAWVGLPAANASEERWFEWAPERLVSSALGFIYQSRWHAEGEDRSADAEREFIFERLRLAKERTSILRGESAICVSWVRQWLASVARL